MQIACDVIYSHILNTSYILQSEKIILFKSNQENLVKIYMNIVM